MEEESDKKKKFPKVRHIPADLSDFQIKKKEKILPVKKQEEKLPVKKKKAEIKKRAKEEIAKKSREAGSASGGKEQRKWKKWITIVIAILILGLLGYFGYKAWDAARKIITDNRSGGSPFLKFFDKIKADELKGEGDGRINVLLLGVATPGHPGQDLSDTVIVASIDPINKNMAMLSIPRDLYVPLSTGGSSKINAAHAFGEQYHQDEGGGPALAKDTVSGILDLPIHYFIRMDFRGFENIIDELGGIDIEVEKDIYDPYYPNDKTFGYEPFSISAGHHHLNGATALKYARSRYTTSDFDRAKRQQQILVAMKKKAVSLNILLNPSKLSSIFDIVKEHLRTDFQVWELEKLMSIIQDVDTENVVHKVLDNTAEGLLKSSMIGGAFVLLPRVGDFSEIRDLAHSIFIEPFILKEGAKIKVQNGTMKTGIATEFSEKIIKSGYNVVETSDAANKGSNLISKIIDVSGGGKPFTLQLLLKRLPGAKVAESVEREEGVDIVIILGDDYN